MIAFDQVREKLQKESEQEHADVHTVDIGIGCDDDAIVTEVIHVIFDV